MQQKLQHAKRAMSLPYGKVISKILVSLGVSTDGTISVSSPEGPMDHVSLLRAQYYIFQGKWVTTLALNSTQLRLTKKETLLLAQGSRHVMCFTNLLTPIEELTVAESANLTAAKEAKAEAATTASSAPTVADVSIESADKEILSEEDE